MFAEPNLPFFTLLPVCFDNGALVSFQDVVMLEKLYGIKGTACHSHTLFRFWEARDGILTGANLGDVMFTTSTAGSDSATDWTGFLWA